MPRAAEKGHELAPLQLTELHFAAPNRRQHSGLANIEFRGLPQCAISTRPMTARGHKPRRRSGPGASLCPQYLQSRPNLRTAGMLHRSGQRRTCQQSRAMVKLNQMVSIPDATIGARAW